MTTNHVTGFPVIRYPLSQVTPFTYRDGWTYLEVLENFRSWVNEEIVPIINDNVDQMGQAYELARQAFLDAVEAFATFKGEQIANYEAFVAEQTANYNDLLSNLIGYTIEVTDEVYRAAMQDGSEFSAYTKQGIDRYRREFITNVKDHGAIGDGVTDDSDSVSAALMAGAGGTVYFPPGTYKLTREFDVPANTHLAGAGSSQTIFDFSEDRPIWANTGTRALFAFEPGTVVERTLLAENASNGGGSVVPADISLFNVGDRIRITSTELSFGEAIKAEIHTVIDISGGRLHLGVGLYDSYSTANSAEIELLSMPSASASGFTIIGKGINPASRIDDTPESNRGDNAINVELCENVRFHDLRFEGIENRCMRLASVFGAVISNCNFIFSTERIRLQYGVSINGASQLITVANCNSHNDRHMVTTSTSMSTTEGFRAQRGIPRMITVTGCTAYGSWQDPIDTHRGGEYITITGNSLASEATGVKVRGSYVNVSDNVITGKRSSTFNTARVGVRILQRGEQVLVANNVIRGMLYGINYEIPDGATRAITIQGNLIDRAERGISIVSPTTILNDITLQNNHISVLGENSYPVYVAAQIGNLNIQGNSLISGEQGIRLGNTSNDSSNRVTIQNNIIRASKQFGIFARNTVNTLITGNMIDPTGDATAAMRIVESSSRVTITNNLTTHDGGIQNIATGSRIHISQNGPINTPTVPGENDITAADLRQALITLGLIQ